MKRLDRAMYAFFLLALLADVAWSSVPALAAGDATGGFMLPASQLRASQAASVNPVRFRRRSNGLSGLNARSTGYRLTLSRWARNILDRSTLAMLAAPFAAPALDSASAAPLLHASVLPNRVLFEHSGSPAP